MARTGIETEEMLERRQLVYMLEDLVTCLKSGLICVQNCSDLMLLSPSKQVELEVRARSKEGKETLTFGLSWAHTPTPPTATI